MKTGEYWENITKMRGMSGTGSTARKQRVIEKMLVGDGDSYWALRFVVGNPLESWEGDIGAKKKTVRKAIAQSFDTSYDEIRDIEKEKGNVSDVIEELERPDSLAGRSEYKLLEVGDMVKEISEVSGNTKISRISSKMGDMENPQVLCYAILNDISFGVGVATIKDAIVTVSNVTREELDKAHGIKPDISQLYLDSKNEELRTTVQPYDRISPQKARKGSMDDYKGSKIVGTKYDGGRVLIHSDGDHVRAFSRKQNEVTDNLPELQEVEWPDTSFIFDGEAVGYDPDTGEPMPFQQFMTRFQREHKIEEQMEEVEIVFKIFDSLYFDGQALTDVPLSERREIVEDNLPDENISNTGDDTQYAEALENGHEGVIIKDADATYKFKRSSTWKKVKPVKEPIEVVVVGMLRGSGDYSHTLGSLKIESGDGERLGKVGTGFKDHERDQLYDMFKEEELIGSVIEIEFEELQERNGRYGLRFPVYKGLRPEGEADDMGRIKQL